MAKTIVIDGEEKEVHIIHVMKKENVVGIVFTDNSVIMLEDVKINVEE